MADRHVTRSGKDADGDITALCNPNAWWSPRQKGDAVRDIETGTHAYYVGSGTSRVNVHVVNGPTGKYLRTDGDPKSQNNLNNLPNC